MARLILPVSEVKGFAEHLKPGIPQPIPDSLFLMSGRKPMQAYTDGSIRHAVALVDGRPVGADRKLTRSEKKALKRARRRS